MATHEERFRALLAEWGIEPNTSDDDWTQEPGWIHLAAGTGNVDGYTGFVASFRFNEDGSFKDMGVWE